MSGAPEADDVAHDQPCPRVPALTYDWTAALDDAALSRRAKQLVLALASFADADGSSIRPGRRAIGRRSGLWNHDITKATTELLEAGWLEIVVEAAGTRPAEYRATLPTTAASGPASRTAEAASGPASGPGSGPGSGPASRTEPGTRDQGPTPTPRAPDPAPANGHDVGGGGDLRKALDLVVATFPRDRKPARQPTAVSLAPLLEAGWTPDDLGRRFCTELDGTEVKSSPIGLLRAIAGRLADEEPPSVQRERRHAELTAEVDRTVELEAPGRPPGFEVSLDEIREAAS